MNIIKDIENWQIERGLHLGGFDQWQSTYNFLEEIFEGLGLPGGIAKQLAYKYQELIKADWELHGSPEASFEDVVDARCDKVVFSIGDLLKLGAEPGYSLSETYKEISSRLQDPEQARVWAESGVAGKWKKWKEQPELTLYKAQYVHVSHDTIKEDKEALREDLLNG